MDKIFITGATGFIGSNLAERLAKTSYVYALSRNPKESNHKYIEYIKGDITDSATYTNVLRKCDVVYNCAAFISFSKKDFDESYRVNVIGAKEVFAAALSSGVKKVIHLSACAVFGVLKDKYCMMDEGTQSSIEKDSAYAYTKKEAEALALNYAGKGLDISIANIATVYGWGDKKLNSGAIIKSVKGGAMKVVPPGGTSFVSVDDLVDGLILLADKGRRGERYIFCSKNMEYLSLVNRIASVLSVRAPQFVLPRVFYYPSLAAASFMEFCGKVSGNKLNLVTKQIIKETFGYKYFSSDKAKRELGWLPRQSLEQAVEQALEYYKENHLI